MQSLHALILMTFLVQAVSTTINPDLYQRGEVEDSRPGNVGRQDGRIVNGHASNNMPTQEDTVPTPRPTTDATEFAAAARETEQRKSVNGVNQGGASNEGRNNRRRQHKGLRKNGNHHSAESGEIADNTNSTDEESQNSKISQKRIVGGKNGKSSRKGDRRGKKGGMGRGHSGGPLDVNHPPQQGRGNVQEAFNHLSRGAGQMMNQWMMEAERRYPEEFSQLLKEWRGIMEDFENTSLEADESPLVTSSEGR